MGRKQVLMCLGGLGLAAGLAAAQPVGPPPDGRPGLAGPRHLERALGLSEEQRAAFQAALEQGRPKIEELDGQLERIGRQVADALAAESANAQEVGELVIQQHRLRGAKQALREQTKKALRELLTAEQQAKLDLLESMRGALGPQRFGGGPGAPPDVASGDGPPFAAFGRPRPHNERPAGPR